MGNGNSLCWKFVGCFRMDIEWGDPGSAPCSCLPAEIRWIPCKKTPLSFPVLGNLSWRWDLLKEEGINKLQNKTKQQHNSAYPKKHPKYQAQGKKKITKTKTNTKPALDFFPQKKETPTHKQQMNMGNGYGYFGEQKWY